MIDTHAHLDSEHYKDDYKQVIYEAFNEGIEAIIIPAVAPEEFENLYNVAAEDDRIFTAIGVHPHNAHEYNPLVEEKIYSYSKNKKTKAIGEIGLDYYYDFCPKDVQKSVFSRQIEIAQNLNLPMIIHNREADNDIMNVLEEKYYDNSINGVFHCFSGDYNLAEFALKRNMMISFTGNITFKKSNLSEVIEMLPIENIMLETDSPYMTPVPMRGKRNHPKNVKLVAEKISEIKKITIEEVISMTTFSAKKFFKLFLIAVLLLSSQLSFAQTEIDYEDDYTDEEIVETRFKRPLFGAGFFVGTNTVVETFNLEKGDKEVSYEGMFTPGGGVWFSPLDFMLVSLNYSFSKNTKIEKENKGLIKPTIHNIFELNTLWIPNPGKTINIYAILGFGYMQTTLDKDGLNERTFSEYSLNTGLGMIGNIEFKGIGLLNIYAEWDLLFPLQKSTGNYLETVNGVDEIKQTTLSKYFSLPRVGIVFYPEIFKNLF